MLDKCMKEEYSALCKKTGTQKSFFYKNRTLVLAIVFLFITWAGNATNYYVSNSGDDSKAGTTSQTAWRTLNKVNNTKFAPGDQILFERGGVWREKLIVPSSGAPGNPIVFGAYGSGANPVIDGADFITGMTSAGSNFWQKTGVTIQPNLMYLDGVIGYPKTSLVACTSEGDWYWDSGTNTLYIYTEKGNPSGNVELGQRKSLFFINGYENITVSNFTVQHSNEQNNPATGINNSGGIYIRNSANNITITGCTIQKNGIFGIYVSNSSNIIVDNNTLLRSGESHNRGSNFRVYATTTGVSNITFSNNQCHYSGQDGVRILGSTKVNHITNVEVHGNAFNNNAAAGLYIQKADSVVVYNNTLDSNGDGTAIGEDYGIAFSSCDNVDVYNNTITNQTWGNGLEVYSDSSSEYGSSNYVNIYKNFIYNCQGTPGRAIQISARDGQNAIDTKIYYNVINKTSGYAFLFGHGDSGIPDTVDVFNNVVYGATLGGVTAAADFPLVFRNNIFSNNTGTDIGVSGSTTGLTISNNLYYKTSGNVLSYNSLTYTIQTITDFEATAVTGDPLFTNAANGDFTLQAGSPAINAGVDVGLTHDILGNPIVGNLDIGAYESQEKSDEATTKYTTEDISICEGESYEGWTKSGKYERTLTAASGADSIITTNLTVNLVYSVSENINILEGENYNGWTESGEYKRTLTSISGCDSIVTTNLTVALNKYNTETIEICEGESYEGWTVSGEYERTLTAHQEPTVW
jgi:parallel beta-helix repeat protein